MNSEPAYIQVQGLTVSFPVKRSFFSKEQSKGVIGIEDINFTIARGSTVGLVGESGSGKTTLGLTLIRIHKHIAGSIFYKGICISELSEAAFFPYRKQIQMVFQDPYQSLNPKMTIYNILCEPLTIYFPKLSKDDKRDRVAHLLQSVGIDAAYMNRYPHAFSGGQRQRIGIARALASEPEFIICDEPVSALDVSIQAQILNLLKDLQERLGLTYLFIAHDLAVVEHMSDKVLVMHKGKIVEQGTVESIYQSPTHSYTQQLLSSCL
jgi:oligopeptide transport system ATP-binding protein